MSPGDADDRISRREVLTASLFAGAAVLAFPTRTWASPFGAESALDRIERKHGGHLGAAILDTADGKLVSHRGSERFPLCSTSKLLATAVVLSRVDRGIEHLERRVSYAKGTLVPHSPITEKHRHEGLTVNQICEAAMTVSDNTAMNLMLDSFGGPNHLTAFLRSLGDKRTRLDHGEPELNRFKPGIQDDTTTPVAMVTTMRKILLGNALSATSRKRLLGWMASNQTGDGRLRAGIPKDWKVGDKTGSGSHRATNDVAIFWPSDRPPLLVAAYYIDGPSSSVERDGVLADVGRLASRLRATNAID